MKYVETIQDAINLFSKYDNNKVVRVRGIYKNDAEFTCCESWRGVYRECAINYDIDGVPTSTVGNVISALNFAIGNTYNGYKGGEYMMLESTPLHVDNYGECKGFKIIGCFEEDGHVVCVVGIEVNVAYDTVILTVDEDGGWVVITEDELNKLNS